MEIVIGRDDLAAAAQDAAHDSDVACERRTVKPVHRASAGFLQGDLGVCEVAIVTMLQAVSFDIPVVLLPITTLGRYQHHTLVSMRDMAISDIPGSRGGVRSWSQTTGVWVRGFLAEEYGVDLRSVHWQAYEPAHVGPYQDPTWVPRAPREPGLVADFLSGAVDFSILGNDLPDVDGVHRIIPDAAAAGEEWSRRHGFAPINHVVGVSESAAQESSAAICAMYDAMRTVLDATRAPGPVDTTPCGFEALRGPVSRAAIYAFDQDVLSRPVTFDEIVERSCDALGVTPARLGG